MSHSYILQFVVCVNYFFFLYSSQSISESTPFISNSHWSRSINHRTLLLVFYGFFSITSNEKNIAINIVIFFVQKISFIIYIDWFELMDNNNLHLYQYNLYIHRLSLPPPSSSSSSLLYHNQHLVDYFDIKKIFNLLHLFKTFILQ